MKAWEGIKLLALIFKFQNEELAFLGLVQAYLNSLVLVSVVIHCIAFVIQSRSSKYSSIFFLFLSVPLSQSSVVISLKVRTFLIISV